MKFYGVITYTTRFFFFLFLLIGMQNDWNVDDGRGWMIQIGFVCDLGVRYMRVNDGTESEQQAAYQERSREWKSWKSGLWSRERWETQ